MISSLIILWPKLPRWPQCTEAPVWCMLCHQPHTLEPSDTTAPRSSKPCDTTALGSHKNWGCKPGLSLSLPLRLTNMLNFLNEIFQTITLRCLFFFNTNPSLYIFNQTFQIIKYESEYVLLLWVWHPHPGRAAYWLAGLHGHLRGFFPTFLPFTSISS